MYNHKFIFKECGFDWLPNYINRDLLFNTSFNIKTGEIKLYFLNENMNLLYKIDRQQITQQYKVEQPQHKQKDLNDFLGYQFNPQEIVIDTIEDNVIYIFTENASSRQFMRFVNAVMDKYKISNSEFIQVANRINDYKLNSISDCWLKKTISGFKIPLSGNSCKIYSRPFKTKNNYKFNEETLYFLTRLYDCETSTLLPHIEYMWVSSEFSTERVMVTTQYHELIHKK
jgi:hypothetical protein